MRIRALATAFLLTATATVGAETPRVLAVIAHPDDETTFAASLFRIARELHGRVDLAVVTSGESGFRYATLAEPIYGRKLAAEGAGRAHLPAIRRRELTAGAAILGVHDIFFLDQSDQGFTVDAREAARQWDLRRVGRRLTEILERGRYGLVLTLLPTATTHGAHQAVALATLEAISRLPATVRPALLGGLDLRPDEAAPEFAGDRAFRPEGEVLELDRTTPFGHLARLDYRMVVNWVIAEHKSQGLLQTGMNGADRELFYVFDVGEPAARAAARALFARLRPSPPVSSWEPTGWLRQRLGQDVCPLPR